MYLNSIVLNDFSCQCLPIILRASTLWNSATWRVCSLLSACPRPTPGHKPTPPPSQSTRTAGSRRTMLESIEFGMSGGPGINALSPRRQLVTRPRPLLDSNALRTGQAMAWQAQFKIYKMKIRNNIHLPWKNMKLKTKITSCFTAK